MDCGCTYHVKCAGKWHQPKNKQRNVVCVLCGQPLQKPSYVRLDVTDASVSIEMVNQADGEAKSTGVDMSGVDAPRGLSNYAPFKVIKPCIPLLGNNVLTERKVEEEFKSGRNLHVVDNVCHSVNDAQINDLFGLNPTPAVSPDYVIDIVEENTDTRIMLHPGFLPSEPAVWMDPMFFKKLTKEDPPVGDDMNAFLYKVDKTVTKSSAPIVRMADADSDDDSGGPGVDGFLLNNFASRNLVISRDTWREYRLPVVWECGEEAFHGVYARFPAMFFGVYWRSKNQTVLLPSVIVEAGLAYISRLEHTLECFKLLEQHVVELLHNVRINVDDFAFICIMAPIVIWHMIDEPRYHGLQRYVEGAYWNCQRVRQTFWKLICFILTISCILLVALPVLHGYL
jgi:hypothetical protein